MKTFRKFIAEINAPKPNATKTITRNWQRRHKGMTTTVKDTNDNLHITDVWLPPEKRNKSIGGRFMKGLGRYADKTKKSITLRAAPEKGKEKVLDKFYTEKGYKKQEGSSRYIRTPNVKEEWIPPSAKKLRKGTESPLSAARKKGTDVDTVRGSVRRYAEPINNPKNPDYDYQKDSSGKITVRSKKHPISVSYSPGDQPNTFIQNTITTGKSKDRVSSGRTMQKIKQDISSYARPGTVILSQPVGQRRASLNTRTQGMGGTNEKGVQGGIVRHRSPRQLKKGAKPLDPINQKGTFIDH